MALTTNEMANFDELSVDKRVEGKYKLHRTLMKLGYIFIPLAIIVLMFAIGGGAFALVIFIPLFYSATHSSEKYFLYFSIMTSHAKFSFTYFLPCSAMVRASAGCSMI